MLADAERSIRMAWIRLSGEAARPESFRLRERLGILMALANQDPERGAFRNAIAVEIEIFENQAVERLRLIQSQCLENNRLGSRTVRAIGAFGQRALQIRNDVWSIG